MSGNGGFIFIDTRLYSFVCILIKRERGRWGERGEEKEAQKERESEK